MISIVQRLEASRTGGVYFLGDSDEAPFVPWTALASRARRAARALRGAGVEPGEVVALSLVEPEHLTLSLLAVVYAGAIDSIPSTNADDVAKAQNYVLAALADLKAGRPVATPVTKPYGCSVKYAD